MIDNEIDEAYNKLELEIVEDYEEDTPFIDLDNRELFAFPPIY